MFSETKREAMSRDNFTTDSRRKHFMCTDRREHTILQKAVEKLEIRKTNNVKKYAQEIKDWKESFKQFEREKEGLIPWGSVIKGDNNKPSATVRQENLIKSVRRSLAPRTTREASIRPVLNYELISKPPSVPHRIKIELLKREEIRLKEEKMSDLEIAKSRSNASLDDAVAMYAKLRKEVYKEMEKRSHVSVSTKSQTRSSKDTWPVSVPSKYSELGTEKKVRRSSLERVTEFNDTMSSGPPTWVRRRPGNKGTISNKKPAKVPKRRIIRKEVSRAGNQEVAINDAIRMPKVNFQAIEEYCEDNGTHLDESMAHTTRKAHAIGSELDVLRAESFLGYVDEKDETMVAPAFVDKSSAQLPKKQRSRSVVFTPQQKIKNVNKVNQTDVGSSATRLHKRERSYSVAFLQPKEMKTNNETLAFTRTNLETLLPTRQRSRSIAFLLPQEGNRYSLGLRSGTLPSMKSRQNSDATTFEYKRARSRSVAFLQPKEIMTDNEITQSQTLANTTRADFETSLPTRQRSRSIAFLLPKEGNHYLLGQRSGTLPLLKSRRNSEAATLFEHRNNGGSIEEETGNQSARRRSSITHSKRFERRSKFTANLSTAKLEQIIKEKIIGQITNVQRKHSISSNQKTSMLQSYARMLQSQLKMDDIHRSESPDFSETPFMRGKKGKNDLQEVEQNDSSREYTHEPSLWKSHLQLGGFQSAVNYSDIEEENVLDDKARRRLSVTYFDAAGIITRKEKASGLAKLRMNQRNNSVHEVDDENEETENNS
ncbi:hypothetical protein QZH41_012898 [Actinostola sp. cb2023]|nr:hypothetical protein QZH41_012898 [Actinostola sp. cb2023]